ncbi:MAG: Ig-like domain-containing protein, partial [Gammaproteobacteria bacterium]|nr:Ig-like domain-containing protein [Gammaproteobacteria bacterium]
MLRPPSSWRIKILCFLRALSLSVHHPVSHIKRHLLWGLFLCLFALVPPVRSISQGVGEERSLWVGEKQKIIQVSVEDGHPLLEIPADHLEDIAADNQRGVLWVGTRKTVIQYTFEGNEVFRYLLNPPVPEDDDCDENGGNDCDEEESERLVHVSLDPRDGSLWIGAKDQLIKLSAGGQKLFSTQTLEKIRDVSVDIADDTAWAGLQDRVLHYASDGSLLLSLKIEKGNALQVLAADPKSHALYLGTKKELIKLSQGGVEQLRITEASDIQDLKTDMTDGSVWLVTKKKVYRYNADGQKQFGLDPCPHDLEGEAGNDESDRNDDDEESIRCEDNLITLAPNPSDGTGWAAWRKTLLKLSPTGEALLWLDGFKQIQALDIGLPTLAVKITEPANGSVVGVPTVTVKGTVTDPTATVTVNGLEATVVGQGFEVQAVPLRLGLNAITATATNLAGLTASDSLEVTYRPPLSVTIDSPPDGAAFSVSRINVSGTVSDPLARILVNGIETTIAGSRFTAVGVPLTLGENMITALALDAFGRTASNTVKVRYAWLDILITSPLNGEVFTTSPIEVQGTVSDLQAYVEVNGIEAGVSTDGHFAASGILLSAGLNAITAQATNSAGQSDADTVQVVYQPLPVALTVGILSPEEGAMLETPRFTVTGTVSDPTATVLVNDTLAQHDENLFTANIYVCEGPGPVPVAFQRLAQATPGSCTITVTAYSSDGQTVTSTRIYTYVPSEDPLTVTLTDPVSSHVVTYSPIRVTGKIHDVLSAFSPTVVTVNGIAATVLGDTFTASVPLADGVNALTAHAQNMVGHDAYDTIRLIYEPATKPLTVSITSPLDRSIVNFFPISVSGMFSDSSAKVDVDGMPADQDFRSFIVPAFPLSIGANLITATAVRPNGETTTAGIQITYDPTYPSPPAPVLGELPRYAARPFIEISGLTLPSYAAEVIVNGASQGVMRADSAGLFKGTVALPNEGPNHLSARAVDSSGNKSPLSAEAVVIRDTIKPRIQRGVFYIEILNLAVSRVNIAAQTEARAQVEMTIDSDPDYHYRVTADEQGIFVIPTHLSAGEHILQIVTTDKAGNTATTGEMHTVYDPWSSRPVPPRMDPIPNPVNESSLAVEGNAYAYFPVEVYRNNELLGTVQANARGRFKLEGVSLNPGQNILKVRQKEMLLSGPRLAFLEAADSPEVVVDVIPGTPARPEVKIDFPVNGAVTDAAFLPLRGMVNASPDTILRLNGYYYKYGYAQNLNGRFVSNQKVPLLPGENTLWIEAVAPDGSRGVDKITVYSRRDAPVPSVRVDSPAEGKEVFDPFITVSGAVGDPVRRVIVNEGEADLNNGIFTGPINLFSGYTDDPDPRYERTVTAWAIDADGKIGHKDVHLRYRFVPTPQLFIASPGDGQIVASSPITVTGTVHDAFEVTVNGVSAQITGDQFTAEVGLQPGSNVLMVKARNTAKAAIQTVRVTYDPGTVTLQSIAINPAVASIPLGATLQLRAIGTYSNGLTADLTGSSVWMSSNSSVAIVNAGWVTGKNQGAVTITATLQGITTSLPLLVGPPTLQSIRVAYEFVASSGTLYLTDNPKLIIGETLQFKPFGVYSDGSLVDISSQVTWTSTNSSVATINAAGLSTAGTPGATQITATNGPVTGSSALTVSPSPMYIFITSPVDGSIANRPSVTVTGSILSSVPGIGVAVNGVAATVSGNTFTANPVPLTDGANTIT